MSLYLNTLFDGRSRRKRMRGKSRRKRKKIVIRISLHVLSRGDRGKGRNLRLNWEAIFTGCTRDKLVGRYTAQRLRV